MADHYVIAYNGQVAEGKSLAAVKQGVAQLFKVDVSKVEHFFSGQWCSIKKGVDEATAKKYQAALAKVGAVCRIVSESQFVELKAAPAAAPVAVTPAPAPIEKPQTGAYGTSETADIELERSVVKEAPSGLGELENISVEASWDHLEEPDNTPPPKLDLSGVVLTERGTDLVNHHEEPVLVVDTGELSLDALGVDMAEHEDVPDLEVDTSGLVIDEPGVIIVEHVEVEKPDIDTSKLSLE